MKKTLLYLSAALVTLFGLNSCYPVAVGPHHGGYVGAVKIIPTGSRVIAINGSRYWTHGNRYWQYRSGYYHPIKRPVGVIRTPHGVYKTLPRGYSRSNYKGVTYYSHGGNYYTKRNGYYFKSSNPYGHTSPSYGRLSKLPRGYKVNTINGKRYYNVNGNFYHYKQGYYHKTSSPFKKVVPKRAIRNVKPVVKPNRQVRPSFSSRTPNVNIEILLATKPSLYKPIKNQRLPRVSDFFYSP